MERMEVPKYGANVEVLAPDSLRTAVAAQTRAAVKLYAR
jgi:predicted DNA-binding transcriptional regulator YafY